MIPTLRCSLWKPSHVCLRRLGRRAFGHTAQSRRHLSPRICTETKASKLFTAKDRKFFESLESLLQKLWTNESLSILGPAAQDPSLQIDCFIRQGYQPPDDFSIDAIMTHVEQCHDTYAEILHASPLRPEHWCELLQKKGDGYTDRESIYYNALTQTWTESFPIGARTHLGSEEIELARDRTGILVQALNGPVAEAAQNVARNLLSRRARQQSYVRQRSHFTAQVTALTSRRCGASQSS